MTIRAALRGQLGNQRGKLQGWQKNTGRSSPWAKTKREAKAGLFRLGGTEGMHPLA